MNEFLYAYDRAVDALGVILFALAALFAVVALVDWAARTRRINPFHPIARFFRTSVDPLMAPIERRVVRAGGLPSSAPWWTLVAIVVGGIIVIATLRFIEGRISEAGALLARGPGGLVALLVSWTFGLLQVALLVRVISSWFQLGPYSRWVRWSYLLTEPILRPLRQVIPTLGMIDITPIVAYFLLRLIEGVILGALIGG